MTVPSHIVPFGMLGASTSFEDFATLRGLQKRWEEMNGYNCGDPETNGEYATLRAFAPRASVFVDVGFNEGEISRYATSLNPAIRVSGFEPNPILPSTPLAGATIRRVALSDDTGRARFFVHTNPSSSGESSLFVRSEMKPSFRAQMHELDVEVTTLDRLADEVIGDAPGAVFLKVDVEGAEAKVFRGARELLAGSRDVFGYFEYSPAWKESGERLQDAFYELDTLGYESYRITPFGLEHIRFFDSSLENYQYSNLFFGRDALVQSVMKTATAVPWTLGSDVKFYRFS